MTVNNLIIPERLKTKPGLTFLFKLFGGSYYFVKAPNLKSAYDELLVLPGDQYYLVSVNPHPISRKILEKL